MAAKELKLGDMARDRISGMNGVIAGNSEYLYGCKFLLIIPKKIKDGKNIDGVWFDEDRVEAYKGKAMSRKTRTARTGGPSPGSHGVTRKHS